MYSLRKPKGVDKVGMDILGIAQQGLHQAQGQVEKTAQRIARVGMDTATPQTPTDSVNLSDEMVSLVSAKNQYEANLGVAHTASEMQKATLSLLA